ncbi:SPW repeat protein [Williamsia serinedens]|uniref:SPW repeat domain-containing protein n=1 Tax=Williamsia serinedens TaxID=391736 RepID=UPI0020A343A2|nr:SPW repeat protein [Williamsia serinedens]
MLITVFAVWALIARDPTRDHWAIAVTGLLMVMAPWLGGFAGDAASWAAWIGGAIAMLGAGSAYVADDAHELSRREELADILR